jgi:hypothetical protein
MKSVRPVAFALLCAAASAQAPPCFAFNDAVPGTVPFDVPYFGGLSATFSPTSALVANQMEIFGGAATGHGLEMTLRLVDAATGLAFDPPLAQGTFGGPFAPPSGWQTAILTAAAPLNPFETYRIDLSATPSPFTFPGSYPLVTFPLLLADPSAATTLLPFDFACFTTLCAGAPTTGTLGLKIRFRGGQCGVAAVAQSVPVGEPCPADAGATTLQCLPPPIPGGSSTLLFANAGPAGLPLFVFWSFGVDVLGTQTFGPNGCPIYLEPTSLALLSAAGFEPLAAGATNGFSMSALFVNWPADPAIAGLVLGLQGVVVDPAGVPTGIPGFGVRTTNGLRATVGF